MALLAEISDCACPVCSLEFYIKQTVHIPFRRKRAGCHAEGCALLRGVHAALHYFWELFGGELRMERYTCHDFEYGVQSGAGILVRPVFRFRKNA